MLCRAAVDEARLCEELSISAAETPCGRENYEQRFEHFWQRRCILVSVVTFALSIVLCYVHLQDAIFSQNRMSGDKNEISVIAFDPLQSQSGGRDGLRFRSTGLDQTEHIEISGALILSNQTSLAPTASDAIKALPPQLSPVVITKLAALDPPDAQQLNDTTSDASTIFPDLNYARLYALLRGAAMPTNTVIITAFDGALHDMTDLFVEHLRSGEGTEELMEHIVVLNFDKVTFNFCQKHKPLHCYFDAGVNVLSKIPPHNDVNKSGQSYQTRARHRVEWRKLELMREVLRFGYNVLYTDNDILFFKDPFPYLKSFDDFQLASDVYQNGRNIDHINEGLYLVKHNIRSHQLYDAWLQDYETRYLDSSTGNAPPQFFDKRHGSGGFPNLRFLNKTIFATVCQVPDDLRNIVTLHAECLVDNDDRLANIRHYLGVREEQLRSN